MHRRFTKLVILTFLTSVFSSCSNQQSLNKSQSVYNAHLDEIELNLEINKKVLSNGLTVLHLENNKLPIVSVYTFFDVGGRYEYAGTTGATHFLEHMMFKKTKNFPAEHFSRVIESNGGNSNAYTTFDNTVYYENIPVAALESVIGLEAERIQNLELEEQPFEKERKVVLEERKMRYENRADGQKFLRMMQEIFVGTPYGGSVIGDEKDVLNLSRDKMMEFYTKFYAPNNAVMVVVGDISSSDLFTLVENRFGNIPKNIELEDLKSKLDKPERYISKVKLPKTITMNGQSETPIFTMAFPSVAYGQADGYVLDILSKILGAGDSSYLNKAFVISKHPKLSNISAGNYTLKNSGVFYIEGELLEKVNLHQFKRELFKDIKKACDNAVTDKTVQKTKNNLLIELYSGLESNDGLASFIGNTQFYLGDYKLYKKELEIYNSITTAQVKQVCNKYLDIEKSIFISVWKKHSNKTF